MKVNDINETLLAEIIEQNGKMQENLLGMKKAIDGLSEDHTKFANQFSPMLKSNEYEEMIPKKDADERARFLIRTYVDLQDRYAQLKADYGELQAKTRYWASNQWAKYLFRWLFLKRHLWIWVVYALFFLCLCLSIYLNVEKEKRIECLENAALKYRYIRAKYACPYMVNWVDSVFEFGSAREMQLVRSEIDNYERSIKSKSVIRTAIIVVDFVTDWLQAFCNLIFLMTAIRKTILQITYFQGITDLTTDFCTSNDRFGLN